MKDFEELLPEDKFFRSHHSYLVNIKYVKNTLRNTGQIELSTGRLIDLSRRKKEEFLKKY